MGVFTLHTSNIKGFAFEFARARPVWVRPKAFSNDQHIFASQRVEDIRFFSLDPIDSNGTLQIFWRRAGVVCLV